MYRLLLFFLLFCLSVPFSTKAQTVWDLFVSTEQLANKAYLENNYREAAGLYEKVFEKTNSDSSALQIARCHIKLNEPEQALAWYEKVENKDMLDNNDWLQQAIAHSRLGAYVKAGQAYKRLNTISHRDFSDVVHSMENISHFYEDSILYRVMPVSLNTKFSEMSPFPCGDGIVFSSSRSSKSWFRKSGTSEEFFDIYYAPITRGRQGQAAPVFGEAIALSESINTQWNESTPVVLGEDQRMIFTRNMEPKRNETAGQLQLFQAERSGDGWTNAKPLSVNSQGYSCAHPAISPDGNTLIFASNMPGGQGGVDLYKCTKTTAGWSEPVNLGPSVNTPGNDMFPYLHNGKTLYYSSDGHGGLGGLDIFATYFDEDSAVQRVNLGYPINSSADDFGIVLDAQGISGYFSSNRTDGKYNDDIFYVEIYKDKFRYEISGTVFLDDTQLSRRESVKPLTGTPVFVADASTGETLYRANTDENGHFEFSLPWAQKYQLVAERANGTSYSTYLQLPVNHPVNKNITIVFIPSLRDLID
jgi:tetratricopeptide (TPR) repeat protein